MRPEWGEAQMTGVGVAAGRMRRKGAASASIARITGAASSIVSVFAGPGPRVKRFIADLRLGG